MFLSLPTLLLSLAGLAVGCLIRPAVARRRHALATR